ncbi:YopX family protein [Bacillus cereus group sp. BfR-BA-01360]|uniref:YopX family protein n=1 Tax=Bacillus cereus group sp. BfR-BA-01360 TaxID=2920321 RepID=UPI001F5789C7|nr:YopX family protein [Bacillus cereus group sp. BfR-BA-01360]
MREIKFRAWVLKDEALDGLMENMMEYDVESFHDPLYEYKQGNIILMQYTGLKDKNGKEIYEGDIVSRHEGGIHFQEEPLAEHVVKWGNFGWLPFEIGEGYQKCVYGEIYEFIVIGNIYENPELLEESE